MNSRERFAGTQVVHIPDLVGCEEILAVRASYLSLPAHSTEPVFDIGPQTRCSVAVVGVLLNAKRYFYKASTLRVESCSQEIEYLIETAGFSDHFELHRPSSVL